jgi:hypothetical protein
VLSAAVGSSSTPIVSAPTNTSPPAISGAAQDGQTLAGSSGSWSGSPASYAYQWQRCDSSGAACVAIAGASSFTYAVQTADVGTVLRLAVTASNTAGSATAVSAQTAIVASAPSSTASTQTQTFTSSLNPGNPARTFTVTVGAGLADGKLSFSKCSSLTLGLSSAGGSAVASASGPSVVVLDSTLAAGTYTYLVSGGRCSLTLTVTAPTP